MIQQMVKSHLDLVLVDWLLLYGTCPHSVLGLQWAELILLAVLALLVRLAVLVVPVLLAVRVVLAEVALLAVMSLPAVVAPVVLPVLLALLVGLDFDLLPLEVDLIPQARAHSGLQSGLSQQLAHLVRWQGWWIRQAGRSSPSAPPYWI